MDKASVFGTEDCRFESCQGHFPTPTHVSSGPCYSFNITFAPVSAPRTVNAYPWFQTRALAVKFKESRALVHHLVS